MTCGPELQSLAQHPRSRIARRVFIALQALLAVALACGLPNKGANAAEGAVDASPDQVVLFLGQNFTGPSKSWSLEPDQPFLAVPYTGDEFRPVSASIKLGADVGVLLFEQPFFSATDETCDYRLGNAADPGLWWLSDKAMFVPGPDERDRVEGNLRSQEIASLILYRRALGPPPGVLLLERRRYVNWDCPAPTKARSYKRLFLPVAPPPHRQGCFNLDTALAYGSSGKVALDFSAASELLLLLPRDQSADYAEVDHRFTAELHVSKDCSGASAHFSHPRSGTRRFELKEVNLDRKARSVLLRYDQGPYDAVLLAAEPDGEASGEAAAQTPEEADSEAAQADPAAEPAAQPAAGDAEQTATPEIAESASAGDETAGAPEPDESASEAAAEPIADPIDEPAVTIAGEPETSAAAAASTAPDDAESAAAIGGLAPAAAAGSSADTPEAAEPVSVASQPETVQAETAEPEPAEAPGPEAVESEMVESETVESETVELETVGSETVGSEAVESEAVESEAIEIETAEPETVEATTEASEAQEPEAPNLESSEPETTEPETAGFLVLPDPEPEAASAGQTFEFPLLQGYRLSACLYKSEGCGEAAASEWCKARGFAGGATAFEIDENIGSLFPTLALGDLQLCANFVCDGFKEITCQP